VESGGTLRELFEFTFGEIPFRVSDVLQIVRDVIEQPRELYAVLPICENTV
jgi:hypothetical protein